MANLAGLPDWEIEDGADDWHHDVSKESTLSGKFSCPNDARVLDDEWTTDLGCLIL